MELCHILTRLDFTFSFALKFMEHPINCILVTSKMSVVLLSHDDPTTNPLHLLQTYESRCLLSLRTEHTCCMLQELDIIAFGLWDELEESQNKEAKIRNTEEMYIIDRSECMTKSLRNSQVFYNVTQCRPLSLAVKFLCSNKVSLIELQFLNALLFCLTLHDKVLPSKWMLHFHNYFIFPQLRLPFCCFLPYTLLSLVYCQSQLNAI